MTYNQGAYHPKLSNKYGLACILSKDCIRDSTQQES